MTGFKKIALLSALAMLASGCDISQLALHGSKTMRSKTKPTTVVKRPPIVKKQKIGKPYQVKGVWYYPGKNNKYDATGIASWYGNPFHGRKTANGETYDMNLLTAAHKTLPLPSLVEVTNLDNGRAMVLRVNDRGPFVQGRIIDVSRRAAQLLGFHKVGVAKVRVRLVAGAKSRKAAKSKIKPLAAAPRVEVSAKVLKPPPGVKTRKKKNLTTIRAGTRVANAPARVTPSGETKNDGRVQQRPVVPKVLFVQAGAFRLFHNANRLRVRLSSFGSTKVSKVDINGAEIFRVRVGPIATVDRADMVLQNVINEGYSNALIVVD